MNIHDSSHNNPHNDILELVMKLPDKFKISIHLYYYEGYQTDEIAHMLSLNPSTLRSRLKKGREIL